MGNYILNACSSNEFHTEERLYLFNRISGDSLGYNHFPLGDRIQCITRLGSAEFCAVGFDIRALGQIVIYKLPALVTSERVNTKKTTGGTIYSPKSTSTCPLITWCSVGMSHPISHIVNLRVINNESINSDDENKFLHLLVAAGNELHIVKFDLIEKNLEIVYSEIWRSAITSLASSGQDTTFAVGTVRTGMDIYRYNGRCDNSIEGGTAFVLLWSAAIPDQVNDSTWLTGSKNLVIADRRGKLIIHNTDTHQRVIKHLPNKDIPLAVCGISEAEFICSAVTGALFKITLTDYS